tara:strand:+ start:22577 stop:24064 length:1488 start_codon:yes stop_codon:yes gene_type:complete
MSKNNLLAKKLKKQVLSINDSIESYFSKIETFISKIKKSKFDPNNKAFLIFGIILISIFTFFSIPAFYDKNIIQSKIKNQIATKYKIETKFNKGLNYGLFPKPHFVTKDFSILQNQKEIAKVKKFKIYFLNDNFFSFNDIQITDLIFNKTEFNLKKENINLFKKLLITKPSENKIEIKDSKIFYKNAAGDVLFISKIFNSEFFYDFNKLENNLISKNEIFNLPFLLKVKNNYFTNQLNIKIDSKKIRLNFENSLNYKNKIKKGNIEAKLFNKDTSFDYKFDDKSFDFNSLQKNFYNGKIEFKPFYLTAKFNYDNLNLKNILNEKSLIFELIKSEILNNENLNLDISFDIKNIINTNQFKDLSLKLNISEGNIDISNSSILWKEGLKITIQDSFLNYDDTDINLIGKIVIDYLDIDNFYSTFQVKKNLRKKIEKIEIDFVYDLNRKEINFDNLKIDNSSNNNLEKFIEAFNRKKDRRFNKITFKNFINNLFSAYAG